MVRIAFIHNSFPAGGAERVTVDIARYLSGLGGYTGGRAPLTHVRVWLLRQCEGSEPEANAY